MGGYEPIFIQPILKYGYSMYKFNQSLHFTRSTTGKSASHLINAKLDFQQWLGLKAKFEINCNSQILYA